MVDRGTRAQGLLFSTRCEEGSSNSDDDNDVDGNSCSGRDSDSDSDSGGDSDRASSGSDSDNDKESSGALSGRRGRYHLGTADNHKQLHGIR